MSDVTSIIIEAIQDRQFESVLTEVAMGFGNCGFFRSDNWEDILETNFNANAYAKVTLEFIKQAVAKKDDNISDIVNEIAKLFTKNGNVCCNKTLAADSTNIDESGRNTLEGYGNGMDINSSIEMRNSDSNENQPTVNESNIEMPVKSKSEYVLSENQMVTGNIPLVTCDQLGGQYRTAGLAACLIPQTLLESLPLMPIYSTKTTKLNSIGTERDFVMCSETIEDTQINSIMNDQKHKSAVPNSIKISKVVGQQKQKENLPVVKQMKFQEFPSTITTHTETNADVSQLFVNSTPNVPENSHFNNNVEEKLLTSQELESEKSQRRKRNRLSSPHEADSDDDESVVTQIKQDSDEDDDDDDDDDLNMEDHMLKNTKLDKKLFRCQVRLKNFIEILANKGRPQAKPRARPQVHYYACSHENCDSILRTKNSQQQHMLCHGEKIHACEFCPKRYQTAGSLRWHRKLHTGEREFSCKACKKCFNRRALLNFHLAQKHNRFRHNNNY